MINIAIEFVKLSLTAKVPTGGTRGAAGYDLYSDNEYPVTIKPGTVIKIPTGIGIAIPEGCVGLIFPRSGLATKMGLRLANSVGVIDSDYRGNIIVALYNDSKEDRIIEPHERIAQIVIIPYCHVNFEEVKSLDSTERGTGGFGSTGTL